jgi:hypothetical protein
MEEPVEKVVLGKAVRLDLTATQEALLPDTLLREMGATMAAREPLIMRLFGNMRR